MYENELESMLDYLNELNQAQHDLLDAINDQKEERDAQ